MSARLVLASCALAAASGGLGCSSSKGASPAPAPASAPLGTTQVMMQFERTGGFYDAPFPSDDLRTAGGGGSGTVNLNAFPNPYQVYAMTLGLDRLEGDRRQSLRDFLLSMMRAAARKALEARAQFGGGAVVLSRSSTP